MTIEIKQDFEDSAFTMLLYGQTGIGKTTFAAKANKVLILNLENGLKGIDLKESGAFATSHVQSYSEALSLMKKFIEQDRFQTLVVDSVTRMQDLMIKAICEAENKKSLADFAYGAGYGKFAAESQLFCEVMDAIKGSGKNVILIAHEQIETFQDPENEPYDRFNVSLDKRIAEKVRAAVDHVWYMHHEKTIKESETGKNKAKHRGRILVQTSATGGVVAKTRGVRDQFIHVKNTGEDNAIWGQL